MRIHRHHPLGAGEPGEERFQRLGIDAACRSHCFHEHFAADGRGLHRPISHPGAVRAHATRRSATRPSATCFSDTCPGAVRPNAVRLPLDRVHHRGGRGESGIQTARMPRHPGVVHRAGRRQVPQQPVEQRHIRTGRERDVQIRSLGRGSAARVQHHHLGAARLPGRCQSLVQHRVTPRGVAAHQHHQGRLVQVLVNSRHHILAERAHMSGHRGRHAQPRVGVDVAATDEALHQLVGDVIVLGQALARHVERHAVRPMHRDRGCEPCGNQVQRRVPAHGAPIHGRPGQPPHIIQRRGKRGAFRAQPAPVGRMVRVGCDDAVRPCHYPASHPAIRAGGMNRSSGTRVHRRTTQRRVMGGGHDPTASRIRPSSSRAATV